MKERISRQFKDISLSFDMHPVTRDILVLKNEDAIKKSIRNIIQTSQGEKLFNLAFGSKISSSLFEFIDFATATSIESDIKYLINTYETRVDNVKVEVNPLIDENAFEITIFFDIVGQDFLQQQEFTYILEATRR